ncbi:hypothetical protein jhhlp_008199 [Lomentospora prolificans]|uniref:NB-ARC domain-containing protein n=1 Tax=Lomentospora prolificans TaxID=41688 RepID=A0A2N3MZB1_9PEZI|nr:hypothetical protein jhhlp_008199 [Lomentospora prolificans]
MGEGGHRFNTTTSHDGSLHQGDRFALFTVNYNLARDHDTDRLPTPQLLEDVYRAALEDQAQREAHRAPSPPASIPSSPCWLVPFGRNNAFVGCKNLLDRLLDIIPPNADKHNCQRTAIEGLGGVGKTQLVLEAAFRLRQKFSDCHVFWVCAIDGATFENGYRDIARKLGLHGVDDGKVDVKDMVQSSLSESTFPWLLIIDNADDLRLFSEEPAPLKKHLPLGYQGSIVFTTRNHQVASKLCVPRSNIVQLQELSRQEASDMLRRNLTEVQLHGSEEAIPKLLDFLCDLPLAITQARAFIDQVGMSVAEYLLHCQSSDRALIKLLSEEFNDLGRYKETQNPIATTWLISFSHIARDDKLAAEYLQCMCFLAEKNIPKILLPPAENELEASIAIGKLKAYAFISENQGTYALISENQGTYNMHRLVRIAMRNWLRMEGLEKSRYATILQRLSDVYPQSPKFSQRAMVMQYHPHALAILSSATSETDKAIHANILSALGQSSYLLGRWKEAEEFCRQSLNKLRKTRPVGDATTIRYMQGLAASLLQQLKFQEARERFEEIYELCLQNLSPAHTTTLQSMNDLAVCLQSQGCYPEAEGMFTKAIDTSKEALGPDAGTTLTLLGNLAHLMTVQGKLTQAKGLSIQVLRARKRIYGSRDSRTITIMQQLGTIYHELRDYERSEIIFRTGVELRTQVLGRNHPHTLENIYKLVQTLLAQKKDNEAEPLCQELVKHYLDLDPKHPMVNNLRNILFVRLSPE